MKIGYIGLGKMGYNMVLRLLSHKYELVVYNNTPEPTTLAISQGATGAFSISELCSKLATPRVLWIMVPHTAVADVLSELDPFLQPGDVVIDGGNSYYKDSMSRASVYATKGIAFLDVGVSGGPKSALNGAALFVSGNRDAFELLKPLFLDLSVPSGLSYTGDSGSAHFVKMIHNGIEYGMMQSIAEGFDILKNAPFKLDLNEVIKPYAHGSVIASTLMTCLATAYEKYGTDLAEISGSAAMSGEGEWTSKTGHELGVSVGAIDAAVSTRLASTTTPSYQGKLISAMRNIFGGHPA